MSCYRFGQMKFEVLWERADSGLAVAGMARSCKRLLAVPTLGYTSAENALQWPRASGLRLLSRGRQLAKIQGLRYMAGMVV
ncbi:MAG: hypothetical protein JWM03_1926 [Rhodocyclales bacterium]|nr:hypothetical protein [Rhodocyclales bacterium]MDB5889054.1 hypothetical protein [Rhodocyclales bacterium]